VAAKTEKNSKIKIVMIMSNSVPSERVIAMPMALVLLEYPFPRIIVLVDFVWKKRRNQGVSYRAETESKTLLRGENFRIFDSATGPNLIQAHLYL
jgi:hypothetical protein